MKRQLANCLDAQGSALAVGLWGAGAGGTAPNGSYQAQMTQTLRIAEQRLAKLLEARGGALGGGQPGAKAAAGGRTELRQAALAPEVAPPPEPFDLPGPSPPFGEEYEELAGGG